MNSLIDKVIFMTGATSGIGTIAAMRAANYGATVIVLARDRVKGDLLVQNYRDKFPSGKGKIEIVHGNLNSFTSVVQACELTSLKYENIDVVVNNAGIWNFEFEESEDGIEETLQVNLLSAMLICQLLYYKLPKKRDAKIIFTTSGLHQGEINFNDMEFKQNFSGYKAYRQSKLGQILLCRLLGERLYDVGISVYCFHPGLIKTQLGRKANWFFRSIFKVFGNSLESGAETLLHLLTTSPGQLSSGEYYFDNEVAKSSAASYNLDHASRLNSIVYNYLSNHIDKRSTIFPEWSDTSF